MWNMYSSVVTGRWSTAVADATAKNGLQVRQPVLLDMSLVNGTIVEVRAYLDSALVAQLFEENPIDAGIKFLRQLVPRGSHQSRCGQRGGHCRADIDQPKRNSQMNNSRRAPHIFVFAITMLVALPSPSPAQVRVLISGGF